MTDISVLMPIYNCQETLKTAIDSILQQTYKDYELIIINDGSSDNSLQIAEEAASKDARLRIISQSNSGIVDALNRGLKEASGEFIARMDGDDISLPERFAEQLKYLKDNPKLALLGTFYVELPSKRECAMPAGVKAVTAFLKNNGNAFVHSSVMMRTEACRALGGYRKVFPHCEDYDLWLRFAEKYEVDNLAQYLIEYRRHAGSISQKNLEQQLLSAIGVRRCSALRRNGFPDPALSTSEITIEQLNVWGVDTDELCRLMIEWLEWNESVLPEGESRTDAGFDRNVKKYKLLRSNYRLNTISQLR